MDLWSILPLITTFTLVIVFLHYIRIRTDLSYLKEGRKSICSESIYAKAIEGLSESPPNFKEVVRFMEERIVAQVKNLYESGKYHDSVDGKVQDFLKKCAIIRSKGKVLDSEFRTLYKDFVKIKALLREYHGL
ncbi:MAG: hypothetical protein RMJ31_05005 [Nitrososphaerota archaeon]|nr:hypothetical protein [Nitrososphaerales archaeon]MDW8045115.1 hypothetical protein [Nitrososphaerota archaeon]